MKGIAAVLLMVLLSVQTFSKWVWALDYQWNKAYISQNLCVNKSKPQLHCNGKCQLAKKLAEDESNNKPLSGAASPKNNTSDVFFRQDIEAPELILTNLPQKHQAFYLMRPCRYNTAAVFRPPIV